MHTSLGTPGQTGRGPGRKERRSNLGRWYPGPIPIPLPGASPPPFLWDQIPSPSFPFFLQSRRFYSEPENPSLPIAPREIQVYKTEASQSRKSSTGGQSIEDNDSDCHFFQSCGKHYQDAILHRLAPVLQALCPQIHTLCRNTVSMH